MILGRDDQKIEGVVPRAGVDDLMAAIAALHARLHDSTSLEDSFRVEWITECERLIPELKDYPFKGNVSEL